MDTAMEFRKFYVFTKSGEYIGEVKMTDEWNALKWASGFYQIPEALITVSESPPTQTA